MEELFVHDQVLLNAAAGYREEMLDGRLHLVVPGVAIAEGVWEGNSGPVLYDKQELKDSDGIWNHRPLVVGHPKKDGRFVSAADSKVLNAVGIGLQLNTTTGDDGKQRFEAWIDVRRADRVDPRIVANVRAKNKVEVSTGMFARLEPAEGEWNGKKYKFKATAIRPDHMAVLLDQRGAMSVADGAGLLANAATMEAIKNNLVRALAAAHGEPGKEWWGYVVATFPTKVIFRNDGETYLQDYSADKDGQVTLGGEAAQVEETYGYRLPDSSLLTVNASGELQTLNQESTMPFDAKAHIQSLIGNGYTEQDRPFLEGLKDEVAKIKPAVVSAVKPEEKAVANAAPSMSVQQYIAAAPSEIQLLLNSGLQELNAKKVSLVSQILANASNKFTKEWLEQQQVPMLEGMAALATPSPSHPVANEYGGSAVPMFQLNNAGPRSSSPQVSALVAQNWDDKE